MEQTKGTLGGFETILDGILPNFDKDMLDDEPTPDELEKLRKSPAADPDDDNDDDDLDDDEPIVKKTVEDDDDDDDDESIIEEPVKRKPGRPKKEEVYEEPDEDEIAREGEMVMGFFDSLSEKLGWEDMEDDDKPKTVEDLIEYFGNVIEENSKPDYASEEIEALDAYVRQGGDIKKYFQVDQDIDLDNIDIEDESAQKMVVKQLLKEKGYSAKQIEKKIAKYEDAGLLEDEAEDALESLKEIFDDKKQQLLKEQENKYKEYQRQQRKLYDDVVSEIKGLETIRGIKVPEKDRRALIDYILKPDTDGQTKYQKDYVKGGVKSLIESAYFTMHADKLISAAEAKGRTKAVDKFRNSLKSPSVSIKTKQREIQTDDDNSIWSSVTRRLRMS